MAGAISGTAPLAAPRALGHGQTQGQSGYSARSSHSLLMVDCGSVHTKVALIGRVEGRYRLLGRAQAPTTIAPPIQDVAEGVRNAIAALERATGRTLLREGRLLTPEQEDGAGADGLTLATSVGGPLRLLTGGPGREALAGLLHHAIGGLFVVAEPLPGVGALPSDSPEWLSTLAQVAAFRPHALVLVGSPFGRPPAALEETIAQASRWLSALRAPAPLPIVFTGSPADAEAVSTSLLGQSGGVQVAEALSPSTLAPLSRAVGALYEASVLRGQPGYAGLRALASTPPTACITGLAGMVRYLAQHYQTNVLGVDVGASATALCAGTGAGDLMPASQPLAGVGPGAGTILRARGGQQVLRWLEEPGTEDELREYAVTRLLRPRLLPSTGRELELEHALAREAIAMALRAPGSRAGGLNPLDVLIGTGGVLANAPHPAMAALILLDALQPRGVTSLILDTGHISNMLGGVASLDSAAAAEVAVHDAVLLRLATCISPVGTAAAGEPVLRVKLEYADGRAHVEDIPQGEIVRLPLATGEQALLTLQPAAGVDVGVGPGQEARASEPVVGGALGLIVDARGRPLALPQDAAERAQRIRGWRRALGLEGYRA